MESFYINSALVAKGTSNSLLMALSTCEDASNFKLPYYEEEQMEIDSGIFQLRGWVKQRNVIKGIDDLDPYAAKIDYPPYGLGHNIMESLNLIVDEQGKTWRISGSNEVVLQCESWSSEPESSDGDRDQSGMTLKASLKFLQHLCRTLDCDILFDISITRNLSNKYSSESVEYSKRAHKIFILSSDGKFRNTSHQPG